MSGHSTVDTKPVNLHLSEARPPTRLRSNAQPLSGDEAPYPGGYGYLPPYAMPPMPPIPPIYYHGQAMPHGAFQSQYPPVPMPNPQVPITQAPAPPRMPVEYPDVTRWFRFLDEHEERNKDGILFAPYGPVLKEKGFRRITQLTGDFIRLENLQEWLGVNVGTAILIMQYAKHDVDEIKAGRLIIADDIKE